MGIDWYRMAPRPGCDQTQLSNLIEQQATAFHGMALFWESELSETLDAFQESSKRQIEQQYLSSSKALRELLIIPHWAPDTGSSDAYPDLEPCRRVSAITDKTIFPLRWRWQAHRSYLPQKLPGQIAVWKAWAAAVAEGQHPNYLLDLYAYKTTLFMVTHCRQLKGLAEASLAKAAKWAAKPELSAVREKILAYPIPTIHPAPLDSALAVTEPLLSAAGHSLLASLWTEIDELIALTRSWDSKTKDSWKLRYYQNYYQTFPQFLDQSKDTWLHSFFVWAERCSALGFGFYLDY